MYPDDSTNKTLKSGPAKQNLYPDMAKGRESYLRRRARRQQVNLELIGRIDYHIAPLEIHCYQDSTTPTNLNGRSSKRFLYVLMFLGC
eukprot:g57591.t1